MVDISKDYTGGSYSKCGRRYKFIQNFCTETSSEILFGDMGADGRRN
jgi:hypothetical protein